MKRLYGNVLNALSSSWVSRRQFETVCPANFPVARALPSMSDASTRYEKKAIRC